MKKRLLKFVLCFILFATVFPLKADASGGYCVIKGEKVYHSVFCSETWGYNIEDMKWYKNIKEVERTGYKPCEYCADAMLDYEEDGSTRWFSKDDKIQSALEMERFMGVMDSVELIEEERAASYDSGYETGYDDGYAEAMNELEEKYKKENKTTNILLIVVAIFFGLPAISTIIEIFLNIVDSFKKKS